MTARGVAARTSARSSTRASGRGAIPRARLPFDRVLNLSGDSRTANCHSGAIPNEISENYGYASWVGTYTDGRVTISKARNGANGGDTTADWLAKVPATIALGGNLAAVLIGTNDRGAANLTLLQSQTNLLAGLAQMRAAGMQVIVIAELPRGGSNALVGQQLQNHLDYRQWQLTTLPLLGYTVVDPWVDMISTVPAEALAGLPRAGLYHDGLHPGPVGARIIAYHVAQAVRLLFANAMAFATAETAYNATTNVLGNVGSNLLMAGITGVKNAAANAVGDLATDWRLSASAWTGATVALGKAVNPLGGQYQTLQLGGMATALNSYVALEQILPLTLGAGKKIKATARIIHEGLAGVCGVSLDIRFVRGGIAYYVKSLDRYQDTTPMDAVRVEGPQETPILTLDGTETDIKTRLVIYGCQNIPLAGLVHVGQASTRVVG